MSLVEDTLTENEQKLNEVYRERDLILSLLAHIALDCGYPVARAVDYANVDETGDFSNVIYLDLPTGQCSWHIADEEVKYFRAIPFLQVTWDGHSTDEKYERIKKFSRNQIHLRG